MPKRRLTEPPPELQWCIKCRKVLGDYHGWFGGQCFCNAPPPTPWSGRPWGWRLRLS